MWYWHNHLEQQSRNEGGTRQFALPTCKRMELDPYFRGYAKMKPTDEDLNNAELKLYSAKKKTKEEIWMTLNLPVVFKI